MGAQNSHAGSITQSLVTEWYFGSHHGWFVRQNLQRSRLNIGSFYFGPSRLVRHEQAVWVSVDE